MKKLSTIFFLLLALGIAIALHSHNMFAYPYFESDEGTYTSQAWALVTQHELAPYTYWYDHPPFGWMVIAAWTLLFKEGFFAFGSSIETGRVLMMLIHAASAGLIYYIVLRATKRGLPAFAATLLFSLSPLAIYFQRRVLLDNIMIFWVLLALAVLFVPYKKMRLRHYFFSGLFFAFAVLTKITAVMFGPALLFLLIFKESPVSRYFRTTLWFMISGMATSIFLLYAMLRSEFFLPKPGGPEHVSFLGALQFQSGRAGGSFWEADSDFRTTLADWAIKDEFFIYCMGFVLFIPLILLLISFVTWLFNIRNAHFTPSRNLWIFLVAVLAYIVFLTRGGITFNFYILPIIPFIGLCIALFVHNMTVWMPKLVYNTIFILIISGISLYYGFAAPKNHFTANETANQKEAIIWVKENIENDAAMLIDSYAYVDLHDGRYVNSKEFPNADWYYKISRDPEIGEDKYNLNWRNFDYIGLTHEMMRQIREGEDEIVETAFDNALPEKEWTTNMTAFVDPQKLISTNGDWAMVYRVNDSSRELLVDAWRRYKQQFIVQSGENYGQVVDPDIGGTTSEGQAYGMLRAVSMYDKEMFAGTWSWTRDHLQFRVEDKLFSWEWKDDKVTGSDNATDADLDIALALLFAYKLWGDESHLSAAQEIIGDVWRQTVIDANGRYVLTAMNKKSGLRGTSEYLVNPSYFSPAWYRIFAEVDPDNDWDQLADDTYLTLNDLTNASWNRTGLPPNWFVVNINTGGIVPANSTRYTDQPGYANSFSFDAFRTLWRVSADAAWFDQVEAKDYLRTVNEYLVTITEPDGSIPTTISMAGRTGDDGILAVKAGYLSSLMWSKGEESAAIAERYYEQAFEGAYDFKAEQWGDGTSYYDANWAWFGTAIYNRKFVNLWSTSLAQ